MKKIAVGLLSLVLLGCSSTLQAPKHEVRSAESIKDESKEREDRLVRIYLRDKVALLIKLNNYLKQRYEIGVIRYNLSFIETKMNLDYFATALRVVEKEKDLYNKVYEEVERRRWLFPTEDKELRKEQINNMTISMKEFLAVAERKVFSGVSDQTDMLRTQNYLLDFEFLMSKYDKANLIKNRKD